MKKTTKKTTKKLQFETAKPIISSEENRISSDLEQNIAWVKQFPAMQCCYIWMV
ncbi:MAG: hypothetical protein II211_01845 [Peptococcaceae bacterium]|nr:hypothetical protein [Peptococcaceae bacterium]